jgi:hypothetical protein
MSSPSPRSRISSNAAYPVPAMRRSATEETATAAGFGPAEGEGTMPMTVQTVIVEETAEAVLEAVE